MLNQILNKYKDGISFKQALKIKYIATSKNSNIGDRILVCKYDYEKNKFDYTYGQISRIDDSFLTIIPSIFEYTYIENINNISYLNEKIEINIPNLQYPNIKYNVIINIDHYYKTKNNKDNNLGFYLQYLAVGILYGGLPSTVYGFFLGYLNVEAYIYSSIAILVSLPWSFKFFFGILNDCYPIFHYNRKYYMIIGWFISFISLILLYLQELPKPYYCQNSQGNYIKTIKPCNPNSRDNISIYVLLMMLTSLGYVIADVAADGLMVLKAKEEVIDKRGSIQTTIYIVRTIGMILSSLLVGLGMNGKQYNGTFSKSLEFNQVCFILAFVAGFMIPISYYMIDEKKNINKINITDYIRKCYSLLSSKAFFYVVIYQFFSPMISNISTPSSGLVRQEWAGVKNLQSQVAGIISNGLFALGLYIMKNKFLNYSWRKMIVFTTFILVLTDSICVFLTIFDIVRNQYFYLGENIIDEIPSSFNFIVSTFIIVEMSDKLNTGLVYGLLTSISNLSSPFARAIGNYLFSYFKPNINDINNYIEDKNTFRNIVSYSFLLSYLFSLISLGFIYFIPNQKQDALERKNNWEKKKCYSNITIICFIIILIYSITINLFTIFPETACLKISGGKGC